MSEIIYSTNPKFASNKLFLSISNDDNFFSKFSDYDEYSSNLFHPHPEETRLEFFNTSCPSGNYYETGFKALKELEEEVQYNSVFSFKKNWDSICKEFEEDEFIPLGVDFYKRASNVLLSLCHIFIESANNHLADSELFDKNEEAIKNWLTDDLNGYQFNKFTSTDWFNTELDDFDLKLGLKKLIAFITNALNNITFAADGMMQNGKPAIDVVIEHIDDLFEFFNFQLLQSHNFSKIFFGDSAIYSALTELTSELWWSNPNVSFVSLYEHSGMCLQWSATDKFDSSPNAALILTGKKDTAKNIFNQVDNILQGNIWDATLYQYIPEVDVKFFNEDEVREISLNIIDARNLLKSLGEESNIISDSRNRVNIKVIYLNDLDKVVCNYNEWSYFYEEFSSIPKAKNAYSIEYQPIHQYILSYEINSFVPEGVDAFNIGDGTCKVSGTNRQQLKDFIKNNLLMRENLCL